MSFRIDLGAYGKVGRLISQPLIEFFPCGLKGFMGSCQSKNLRIKEITAAAISILDKGSLNIYCQQKKIAWALRLLPSKFFALEELGIPLPVLQMACRMQKGMVLVTGATGSGKSTTLASIIHEINKTRNCHIFTIEAPVEYKHENIKAFISQREVGNDTASTRQAH